MLLVTNFFGRLFLFFKCLFYKYLGIFEYVLRVVRGVWDTAMNKIKVFVFRGFIFVWEEIGNKL